MGIGRKLVRLARLVFLTTGLPVVMYLVWVWWRHGQIDSSAMETLFILTGCICVPVFIMEYRKEYKKEKRERVSRRPSKSAP